MKNLKFKIWKLLIFTLTFQAIIPSSQAQSPQKMSYQAVVRNSSNQLVVNQMVGMQISILQGSESGTTVYTETQKPTTNANGLATIEIGAGTSSDDFSAIDWANGHYYIKTATDPTGGTSYTINGVSQLLSVPYALYAINVENDKVDDADADPTNEIQVLSKSGNMVTLSKGGGSFSVDDADADPTNEIQALSISGNNLTLSKGGGTVTLPSSVGGDNWGSQIAITNSTLEGNGTTATPLKIAQQAATNGQVLKWNGATWAPGNDASGESGLTLPYSQTISNGDFAFSVTNSNGPAIEGKATSVSNNTSGVKGSSSSTINGSSGVYGINTASTGITNGVYGETSSPSGNGVFGHTTSETGVNFGVYGTSSSPNGKGVVGFAPNFGVYGQSNSASGLCYGVKGISASINGSGVVGVAPYAGVSGESSSTSGTAYGLSGLSFSTEGTGVFGTATSASGLTFGVRGESSSTTNAAAGVYGKSTALTGSTYGVRGETSSPVGFGIYGYNSSVTGGNCGIYGESASNSGTGVYGKSPALSGLTFGVRGLSSSTTGFGVYGFADAASGTATGVSGETFAPDGKGVSGYAPKYGVYGIASSPTAIAYGVYGQTSSTGFTSAGVFGYSSALTGGSFGVRGESSSTVGFGVYGHNSAPTGANCGVFGEAVSPAGSGVIGSNTSETGLAFGVRGFSSSTTGIGVYGIAEAITGTASGVSGQSYSPTGKGVSGYAALYGVYGRSYSTSGITYGIYGEVSSTDGYGVYGTSPHIGVTGISTASENFSPGVQGRSSSPVGCGVFGTAPKYGVFGECLEDNGYAGYFNGRLYVLRNVGIGTLNPLTLLDIDGNSVNPELRLVNDATGRSSSDGLKIGSSGYGYLWNYENTDFAFGTNNTERFTIKNDGKIGIGTIFPGYKLDVAGDLDINSGINGPALYCNGKEAIWFNGTYYSWGFGGTYNYFSDAVTIGTTAVPGYALVVSGTAAKTDGGSWSNLSDIRLKDLTGNYEKGLKEIVALQPVKFFYKKGNPRELASDKEQIGFVAQDVQKVFPEAVTEAKDGYLDFNIHAINVAVVNAIKELKKENDLLKAENELLKSKNEQIDSRLTNIEKIIGVSALK